MQTLRTMRKLAFIGMLCATFVAMQSRVLASGMGSAVSSLCNLLRAVEAALAQPGTVTLPVALRLAATAEAALSRLDCEITTGQGEDL